MVTMKTMFHLGYTGVRGEGGGGAPRAVGEGAGDALLLVWGAQKQRTKFTPICEIQEGQK